MMIEVGLTDWEQVWCKFRLNLVVPKVELAWKYYVVGVGGFRGLGIPGMNVDKRQWGAEWLGYAYQQHLYLVASNVI